VRAYLDTEFTDLVAQPQLLSVGLVTSAGDGREFYAEVTDPERLRATGWFGLCAVLPKFGKIAKAACTYAELGARLSTFLADLASGLDRDEHVHLAHWSCLDWDLIDLAIRDSGSKEWASTRRRIRPVLVDELTGFSAGTLAAETYFNAQALAPVSRHHALCDARALRVACETVMWAPAVGSRAALRHAVPARKSAAAPWLRLERS